MAFGSATDTLCRSRWQPYGYPQRISESEMCAAVVVFSAVVRGENAMLMEGYYVV